MRDYVFSAVTYSVLLAYVSVRGDPIFIGLWYYFALAAGIWIVAFLVRAEAYFRSGATLALGASLLLYIVANATSEKPDGLLGLGHLFSIPGAYIGLVVAVLFAKNSKVLNGLRWFVVGFVGFGIGFIVNQTLVCNTLMYCGALF